MSRDIRTLRRHRLPDHYDHPDRDDPDRRRVEQIAIRLGRRGALGKTIGLRIEACPGFAPYERARKQWCRHRVRELCLRYGELSSGVCARLRSASWGFAFGEWVAARAASHGDAALANLAMILLAKARVEDDAAVAAAQVERDERALTARAATLADV